jgi:hypothetical protein
LSSVEPAAIVSVTVQDGSTAPTCAPGMLGCALAEFVVRLGLDDGTTFDVPLLPTDGGFIPVWQVR